VKPRVPKSAPASLDLGAQRRMGSRSLEPPLTQPGRHRGSGAKSRPRAGRTGKPAGKFGCPSRNEDLRNFKTARQDRKRRTGQHLLASRSVADAEGETDQRIGHEMLGPAPRSGMWPLVAGKERQDDDGGDAHECREFRQL